MNTQQHPLLPNRKNRQTKDRWSRISKYLEYLDSLGHKWYSPDMEGFKASLMADDQLAPATVAIYISSVKQAYRDLLEAHSLEQLLRNEVSPNVLEETYLQAEKAIEHAIKRDTAKVDYERPEDIRHPSFDQVITLIDQISLTSAMDLRDLLVVSLIVFTGMSEVEVCALTMDDFEREVDGKDSLNTIHIPEVSGGQERQIAIRDDLFYAPRWWRTAFFIWKRITGITSGPMFRSFYKGGNSFRKTKMSPVAVQNILKKYDLPGDEHEAHFTAQDLRRAYAHRLFYIEDDFDAVRTNLGYNTRNTIRNYIGLPNEESHADADRRGEGAVLIQKVDDFMKGKK